MFASEVFFGDAELEEANLAHQILLSVMKVRTQTFDLFGSLGLKTEVGVSRILF